GGTWPGPRRVTASTNSTIARRAGVSRHDARRSPRAVTSVACEGCRHLPLDIEVGVVGDVVDDLDDPPAAERELRRVLRADRIAAVVADAEPLAAYAVAGGDRPDLLLGDDLLVDEEPHRPVRLVVLAHPLLRELDADDVGA